MTEPDPMQPPVLETRGLDVRFGGVTAVAGISLQLARGELVGLIGPNGAGKTTAVNAMCGFVPHTGSVLVDGRDLSSQPPHARALAGLARTWQSLELFDDLTVAENCQVASEHQTLSSLLRDAVGFKPRAAAESVEQALDALELQDVAQRRPSDLSLGQRKLVGVARALAAEPKVLLLDEPAAGLDSAESRRFGELLERLVESGLSILLIDHDMGLVLSTCRRVYVLESGDMLASGTPAQVRHDPQVISAYLGADADVADEAS
jgi:branched-chain amino acid transport system ATP-binding protein